MRRGGLTTVTVNVLDGCSIPVADGWPIQLSAQRGQFVGGGSTITLPTAGGRVQAVLMSGRAAGPLRIVARHGSTRGETVLSVEDRWAIELYMPLALNW